MKADAYDFSYEYPEPGRPAAVVLALLVHVVLIGMLFVGVRWHSQRPQPVTVELWEIATPRAPEVIEPPKPEPRPEPPPEVKPAPRIEKPDIALAEPKPKPKPEPKPEPKPKPKPKPEPKAEEKPKPRPDEFQRQMREQLALEQERLAAQRREQELRELLARESASLHRRALDEYIARIQAKVKSNWILPADMKGNPETVINVVQLPTGEVLSTRVVKPSGIPAYDSAVERAILKSSPLPLPSQRELFARELKLTFRPRD